MSVKSPVMTERTRKAPGGGTVENRRRKAKSKVPWEGLVKVESQEAMSPARMEVRGGSVQQLRFSPNSSINYSDVHDPADLYNSRSSIAQTTLAKTATKGSFNLKDSFNSRPMQQSQTLLHSKSPPRSTSMPLLSSSRLLEEKSSPPITSHRQSIGPTDGHLSHEVEDAIVSGSYVDFVEILGPSKRILNRDELRDTLRKDILTWVDCFSTYVSVSCGAHPIRVKDLMKYQRIVLWIYREVQDPSAWWRYDTAFRRKAELKQIYNWGYIDEELFAKASSTRLRDASSCVLCLSNEHNVKKCPFMEDGLRLNAKRGVNQSGDLNGIGGPSYNETLERALANPTKLLKRPSEGLRLKFAFGYHGYNACNNVFYTQSNEMVFHTAALGIVYSPQTHEQRFYIGHDDDILCLTIHDEQDFVATGQLGKAPSTHIWDARTMRVVSILKGFHKRGIICVDFSGDGTKLADVGMDDDHCICIWDWRKQEKLASTRGHKEIIFNLEWNPYEVNHFVSVGVKHIKFWTLNGSKIDKRTATFGKAGELSDMLCVCHSPYEHLCYVGSSSGEVYVWQGTTFRKAIQAHKGPVYAMFALLQSEEKGFVTGGKDGVVVIWDEMFTQPLRAFQIETPRFPPGTILLHDCPPVRSIHTDEGRILVGTGHDDIIQIFSDGSMEVILQGHGEGELWGLAVHPHDAECATVSDDKTLRVWDLNEHRMTRVAVLRKGGRCLDYHPTGDTIAVGLNDGSFMIVDSQTLQTLLHLIERKEEISDIKFSPDGKFLGVASHDNMLDVYSVKRGKRCTTLKGNSSYLTHFDWDSRGRLIQTNSGAREHLLFEAPSGRRKTMALEGVIRIDWHTFTCVLGPTVKGIFPPLSDVTDVNAASRSKDYKLLATGDDFGQVKLFQYPVLQRSARSRVYKGHCSHVTNVRWTKGDDLLLSTGGMDATLLVWERVSIDRNEEDDDEEQKIQPKFIPTGTIKNPISRGKPVWD